MQPWQPTNWQGSKVSKSLHGNLCRKVPVPNFVSRKTMSQVESDMVGSMKQRPGWNVTIGNTI